MKNIDYGEPKTAEKAKKDLFKVMVARVRYTTHAQLVDLANKETDRSGRQIYVADLVREAIKIYLRSHIITKTTLDGSTDSFSNMFRN